MGNTYNVKLSFKGEGSFTFTLPGYGELTVYNGKDIFIKDLSINGVELLRQLRPLMLQHQLNAKPDGCYKVIDLSKANVKTPIQPVEVPVQKSLADLKAEMIKTNGPIEEPKETTKISEPEDLTKSVIIPVESKSAKTISKRPVKKNTKRNKKK